VGFGFRPNDGFGFASVLTDLGLPQGALLLALVGFNLGVEAGQLLIVAVLVPLAYAVRRSGFYRRVIFVPGSAVIAAVALGWMIERGFDLKIFSKNLSKKHYEPQRSRKAQRIARKCRMMTLQRCNAGVF